MYGKTIISTLIVSIISYQVYTHLIYPFVFEFFKIGYHSTLKALKDELEQGVPVELQTNPRVIKHFFKVYHEFCMLRIIAKRDYRGMADPRDKRWVEYDQLNFKKGYLHKLRSYQV
ncbi:unnamed protein product [Bursaphelenchus okinawaensis]|uniref:Uncharacterized protein n=1 Tax=Bursaphelenchus okinawaensis TaxID=465554 RepID=A0A811LAK4_9BILA|nr:unnamed protein product [Bursaphelenchus okinawaensis]CAG9122078.1 unnamed protein product [Bursaphelenchus okinawaensis]